VHLGSALRAPPALRRPTRAASPSSSSHRRIHRRAVVPTAEAEAGAYTRSLFSST
jgi:hypothetical protein